MNQEKTTYRQDMISHRISIAAGGAVLGLGLIVLGGWMFDISIPKWPEFGWDFMMPNTALCFALLGGALCLMQGVSMRPWQISIARICACAAILIGFLTLIEYMGSISFGTDDFLFKVPLQTHKVSSCPMGVTTALNFIILGSALLFLLHNRPWLVRTLTIAAGLSSYLSLLERIFREQDVHWVGKITAMTLHTSSAFLLLCLGMVAASNDAGVLILIGSKRANIFIWRLLPAALIVPLILGWLRLVGQRRGLYGTEFGIGLMVVIHTGIIIVLILRCAKTFHKLDAQREHAEAEFEHERFMMRALMDNLPDSIYFKDTKSQFLRNNRTHLKHFGLVDTAQALGKSDFDFFSEEHAHHTFEDEQQIMKSGQSITKEDKEIWPNGRVTWSLISKMPLLDVKGQVIGTFGVSHDITNRKKVEEELLLMSNRLSLATRAAAIGIWDFDPDKNQLVWDEEMFRIFGVEPDQFSGTCEAWQATVHPDDLPQEMEKLRLALEGVQQFDSEYRVIWPDQSIHFIKADGMVLRDAQGKATRMVGTNWDITAGKHAEQRFSSTAAELARSNADLAQFASVASHDLQEPLRAVAGCVELLAKDYGDNIDEEAGVLIRHILDGTKRMQTLIRDLLEYSRLTTRGKPPELTNVNSALDVALANMTAILIEREVVITRDPLPSELADSTQLSQIFQNLIGNGIKFCAVKRPEIHIGAEWLNGTWSFSVRDNGIGIEPQYHDRIFVLFQRLHTRTEYPGTGIGLSLCKRIVERHDGRIWVESLPGKGSTFFFTLSAYSNQTSLTVSPTPG